MPFELISNMSFLGLNDTAQNLLRSIENNEPEISPSTLFAVSTILEGWPYINGSPQNTFVPGTFPSLTCSHLKNEFSVQRREITLYTVIDCVKCCHLIVVDSNS
jgi:hypothetical protein